MAKLYDLNKNDAPGELTRSLAHSLKNGLFAPAEKRFNTLEKEIATLRRTVALDTQKFTLEANERFSNVEKELLLLRKLFRIGMALSVTSLAGITATLIFLFNWY